MKLTGFGLEVYAPRISSSLPHETTVVQELNDSRKVPSSPDHVNPIYFQPRKLTEYRYRQRGRVKLREC